MRPSYKELPWYRKCHGTENERKGSGDVSDSRLVVGQVKGELEARDARMQEYLSRVKRLQPGFDFFSLSHVPRSGNTYADSLAALATSSAGDLPRIILIEHLDRANVVVKGTVHVHEVRVGPSWMDPIMRFLKDDILPEEKSEAEKIQRKASRFWLFKDHKLYKRSYRFAGHACHLLSRGSASNYSH